jgi:hypothetical protein
MPEGGDIPPVCDESHMGPAASTAGPWGRGEKVSYSTLNAMIEFLKKVGT